jgi:hypothetical protein
MLASSFRRVLAEVGLRVVHVARAHSVHGNAGRTLSGHLQSHGELADIGAPVWPDGAKFRHFAFFQKLVQEAAQFWQHYSKFKFCGVIFYP